MLEPERPESLPKGWGVEFRDVSFRYPATERPVLAGFNLKIEQGQVVAILGPNGAGKTTLAKLLCRLYDVEDGAVLVGGTDVRRLASAELRSAIAVLPQHPMQYNATARENVADGDIERSPSEEEIRRSRWPWLARSRSWRASEGH